MNGLRSRRWFAGDDEVALANRAAVRSLGIELRTDEDRPVIGIANSASDLNPCNHGLTALARVHTLAVVGSDPVLMLTGPIEATRNALGRAGMKVGDIDVFEVNEAFAPVLLAWSQDTGASLDRANPNGGAIALGHPLGATGSILMTKLVHELQRTGGRFGLQTMCEGGGQANATIVERV